MKTNSSIKQQQGSLSLTYLKIFAIIMILLAGNSVMAQQGGQRQGWGGTTPEERAKRQTDMMKTQLNLTATQEPKVSDINLKYAKKMEEVRKISDTAVLRKTAKNAQNQRENELKSVLTVSQFKEYLKVVEQLKKRRRDAPH